MSTLPCWDLESIYPESDDTLFNADIASLSSAALEIETLVSSKQTASFDDIVFKKLISLYETMLDTYETIDAYANALLSVNTADERAVRKVNDAGKAGLTVQRIHVAVVEFMYLHRTEVEQLLQRPSWDSYRYVISLLLDEKQHLMSSEMEDLAADLNRSGSDAFTRLHEAVTSSASIEMDGEKKTVIELRAMAFAPDRKVRKKAFSKELELLKEHETALAFALNGVKGTALTLYGRRNYSDALENALKQSRISRKVLDAMISSIEDHRSMFERYFTVKAHYLGLDRLSFYDLFAPVGESASSYTFAEARSVIIDRFSSFHPQMGSFAKMAFEKGWIDSAPHAGKVGGAYCTSFPSRKETRILCNYDGSFDALSTVAHELGHGYHDWVTKDLPALQRHYPMTLAETASIFSQFIIFQGVLENNSGPESITFIESFLSDASQTCIDILSRFYFEQELFEKRKEGELSPQKLCDLMTDAQKRSYGNGLKEEDLHPYMWAVKGHYYSVDLPFYNFPYAFGQLFSLGLYREYEKDRENFPQRFDALLRLTGVDKAEKVTESAACDITDRRFWDESLSVVGKYIDRFCDLTGYSK
ncbi:MAG: M3 family oligoendopeptidase [Sphaerochaetaceae bacterium]